MMVGIGAASPPCTSSRPSWPFRRLTRAHEELATYIDGWGVEAAVHDPRFNLQ